MQDLIERLEKATGPCREIDGLIYGYLNGLKRNGGTFQTGDKFQFEHPTKRFPNGPAALYVPDETVREFTDSIDAALMLVPEGWQWQISNRAPEPNGGRAYLNNRQLHFVGIGGLTPNPKFRGQEDVAATPAIALCVAALKARSAMLAKDSK